MNTEINLLEQKPKKNVVPIMIIIVSTVLFATVLTVLLLQKQMLDAEIGKEAERLMQVERLLMEHNESTTTQQRLQQIQEALISINNQQVPRVGLYHMVMDSLSEEQKLESFVYSEPSRFVLEATFDNLESVARYINVLLEKNYIVEADLTSVNDIGQSYQATLTFDVDVNVLREEYGDE